MVRQQIVRVRQLVTLHLVALAFLTATLVAVGSGSVFLPLLVLVVGVSSLLFVDWLEWFALHHVLAYVGMVLGTVIALVDYFFVSGRDSSAGQLYAIASLLIYPEIVIMLQRKNMRLFEQMAIFLLLEIIVAALVNDNVLFGVLLAPIVVLWVSSLLLLTRYTALIQLAPDLDRPAPRLVELVIDLWRKARNKKSAANRKMLEVIQPANATRGDVRMVTLFGQSLPIGGVSILFAGLYFYLLPRAAGEPTVETYALSQKTGFSESLSLGGMGKLLKDTSPVIRLKLSHADSGATYRLAQPPYIRGTVVSRYLRGASAVSFEAFESFDSRQRPTDRPEPLSPSRAAAMTIGGDSVIAQFELIEPDGSMLPCIAPMINNDTSQNYMHVLPFEWRMINNRSDNYSARYRPTYTLFTTAFKDGEEQPLLADSQQVLNKPSRNVVAQLLARLSSISEDRPYSTTWIDDFWDKVDQPNLANASRIEQARAAEAYLSSSGAFAYSLVLRHESDPDLDPIADFVVNQKRGHCQYFAAALTMALRHKRIPTRIVLGYHPLEYNEIGEYFTVRKSDAHAWVEAYFSSDELKQANLYSNDLGATGAWLRLDPTPAGLGSNAGSELRSQQQPAAIADYAEQLWNDLFLNSRQRAEDSSFYAPLQQSTLETYRKMVSMAKELLNRMKNSQFVGGAIKRDTWFSWPLALTIVIGCFLVVAIWKLVKGLPRWAPRLAKKLGMGFGQEDVTQQFYRQCLKVLRRAGFVRQANQTAREFTVSAGDRLVSQQIWSDAPRELEMLTSAYYGLRFGGHKTLDSEQVRQVTAALDQLERHVK